MTVTTNGKPRYSQSQGSVERANRDTEKILAAWVKDHNSSNWSKGIKFVQFLKNRVYLSGIKRGLVGRRAHYHKK